MRFLFVDLGSGWGGSERYLCWLMDSVRSRGHWVGCVGPRDAFAAACDRFWPVNSRFKHLWRVRELIQRVAAAEKVHAVHFNADRAIHIAPFVRVPAGVRRSATKHLTKPQPRSRLDLRTKAETRLTNFSLARLDLSICVSRSMLEELPRSARRRAVLVDNGVPDERPPDFVPQAANGAVFLGRVSPEKGIDDLVELAERAGRRAPAARRWSIRIAGTGPLADQVAAAEKRLPPGTLAYLGFQDDPGGVYSQSGALILPSSHEGMPLVILEAFSWGLPVIAYDIPGVRDVVVPDRNGILVSPAEGVDGLERALDRLFGDDQLRANLGRAAREDYERCYRVETMLGRTVTLLESLPVASPSDT